jgi:RNA polymerase sigma-70 factor (ECF subfamily)
MTRDELLQAFPAHRGRLVAALSRLVEPAEAEDLAQETLLRALAAVDGFRGEAALGTWLHRIGTNLAYDLLRRRSGSPVLPGADAIAIPEAATETLGGEALEQRQTMKCIRNMLAKLPPQQRDVLIHADMFERTVPEIARDAGISLGNAKIRLHRARQAMKAAMEESCALYHGPDGQLLCTPKS